MEFPHVGKQCNESSCKKLDFLPITCDTCRNIFCEDHYRYANHNCPNAYLKNNQVPVCPLCNIPIPISRGQQPDITVGRHIDNDCQSDPAKNRRKVFTNKCSKKGCKIKEVIPVICNDCRHNYCLKHRHPSDHNCKEMLENMRRGTSAVDTKTYQTQNQNGYSSNIQGNISEDEALARALALSMQESVASSSLSQEDLDLALARQLQMEAVSVGGSSRSNNNRCNVQ